MRRTVLVMAATLLAALAAAGEGRAAADKVRRLPVKEYVDKMKAGWVGQMAGVGQGGPTEFRVKGEIMAPDVVPKWQPAMINQFGQDDLYVEMTFLRTLEVHGLDVSIRQAGIDFAASGYDLWHANNAGRTNLRKGIAPPDSSHPKFNGCADDIDYQIEADFSGLVAPGLPNVTIALGETFGRLMNYGDGMYAGQFVGALYGEAFFESDMVRIIRVALKAVPADSQYAGMVRDVLAWHEADPDDWEKTWGLVEKKYHEDPKYTHGLCSGPGKKGAFSIDAKLNGAYILLGLLYGKGDPDRTIVIATRCGQDSDCNPSNAGGVLFTTIGFEKLPDVYKSAIDPDGKFSHTPYNFPTLIQVCEKLARQAVAKAGGRIEKDAGGDEVFVIPIQDPKPSALKRSWEPGPIADSKFTAEEMAKIQETVGAEAKARAAEDRATRMVPEAVFKAFEAWAPGWKMADCGKDMDPGLRKELAGRENVFVTHPLNRAIGCVLSRKVAVPAGKKTALRLEVGHDERGDWDLLVRVDGKEVLRKTVGKDTAPNTWMEATVDLSAWAGKEVRLELVNQPTEWSWEAAFWSKIEIASE